MIQLHCIDTDYSRQSIRTARNR